MGHEVHPGIGRVDRERAVEVPANGCDEGFLARSVEQAHPADVLGEGIARHELRQGGLGQGRRLGVGGAPRLGDGGGEPAGATR